MEHITIKVNNRDEIEALSSQMGRLEPKWIYNGGVTNVPSYYIIYFEGKGTFDITKIGCDSNPASSLLKNVIEYSNCEFFKLPSQIQDKIIELSKSKSYIPFIMDIGASEDEGGFWWDKTEENQAFWETVLAEKDFELFFEHFNNKTDESRLQKQDSIVSGGSREQSAGICCRRHKITITVNTLGNKTVTGRG